MVNRVWLWHFNEPIAGNPNNFGSTGKTPTHPELLEWLANVFVQEAWLFKALHRKIMLSEAYRRSIYMLKLRGLADPMLEVFNSPAPDFSCERRDASTVTPQVFSLFNGQSSHARALALANRALEETDNDDEANRVVTSMSNPPGPTRSVRVTENRRDGWVRRIKSNSKGASPILALLRSATSNACELVRPHTLVLRMPQWQGRRLGIE